MATINFYSNGVFSDEAQVIISDSGFLAEMVYKNQIELTNISKEQNNNIELKSKDNNTIIQNPHTKTKFEVKQIINDEGYGLQMMYFKELDSNKNYIMYAGTDVSSFNDIQNNIIILEKQKNFQAFVAERYTKQIIENIKAQNPDALNIVGGHSLGGGTAQEQAATNKDIDLALTFNAFGANNTIKAREDYDPKLAEEQSGKVFNFSTYGDPVTPVNEQYGQNFVINEDNSYLDLLDPSFWFGRHGIEAVNEIISKAGANGYIKIGDDKFDTLPEQEIDFSNFSTDVFMYKADNEKFKDMLNLGEDELRELLILQGQETDGLDLDGLRVTFGKALFTAEAKQKVLAAYTSLSSIGRANVEIMSFEQLVSFDNIMKNTGLFGNGVLNNVTMPDFGKIINDYIETFTRNSNNSKENNDDVLVHTSENETNELELLAIYNQNENLIA